MQNDHMHQTLDAQDKMHALPISFIIPYPQMVDSLFKVGKELGNFAGNAMHAAIGISGEAAELLLAGDRVTLIEELGDIEFYLEALQQQAALTFNRVDSPPLPLIACVNGVVIGSGMMLDAIKKSWVYNQGLNTDRIKKTGDQIRTQLDMLYDLIGFTREAVQYINQQKLIGPNGRYPDGRYSDQAARARADKRGQGDDSPGGEQA